MNASTTMQNDNTILGQILSLEGIRLQPNAVAEACKAERMRESSLTMALVHDWCPSFRGGERVVSEICRMYSVPLIYTIFDFLSDQIKREFFPATNFQTSIANRLPGVEHYYRSLFFVCPFLIEQFDVTEYDLVVSSSAAFARGVITRPDQPHICYVHSPARYAWDEQFAYIQSGGLGYGPKGLLFRYFLHKLRTWDIRTAHNPDLMAANSNYIKKRIRRIYGRDAIVIFPPVAVSEFPFEQAKDDYYVTASFLAPYKRTDLVIEAFNEMPSKRLVVVGEGQQSKKLRGLAGPNITFTGYLSRCDYVKTIAEAQALVFAGCEDFGIALAEAQAAGTPVIAFQRGGASDIVRPLDLADRPTGVLFQQQSVTAIKDAVARFEVRKHLISPAACHINAQRFSPDRFRREFAAAVDRVIEMHR
jgi:glycosyltransferase involved in cell wall biosynthesis